MPTKRTAKKPRLSDLIDVRLERAIRAVLSKMPTRRLDDAKDRHAVARALTLIFGPTPDELVIAYAKGMRRTRTRRRARPRSRSK